MGTCLREVETLAFLKVKRAEAGLTRGQARFAELASWFYRRSAIGGVDHVFLVFRGGGVSLREAMQERASPVPSVVGGISKQPSSVWQPSEVVAVARGLLEASVVDHFTGASAVSPNQWMGVHLSASVQLVVFAMSKEIFICTGAMPFCVMKSCT